VLGTLLLAVAKARQHWFGGATQLARVCGIHRSHQRVREPALGH
jgi:hypothetical protein